jgi:hypothetical protein
MKIKMLNQQMDKDYNNYQARVVVIDNVRKHENADRLQITNIFGSDVVIGLGVSVGDVGLYFISGTQLSTEFASSNDLVRKKDPVTGEVSGGMFDENRRVRAQTLRGQKSDGFFIELPSLIKAGVSEKTVSNLKNGDSFVELDDIPVCNKYIIPSQTPGTIGKARIRNPKELVSKMFLQHFDTPQFRFVVDKLLDESIIDSPIVITEKLHGTSQRTGNMLIKQPLVGFKRFISRLFSLPTENIFYKHIIGTRRTIVKSADGYHSRSLRIDAASPFMNLHKGETVYYEVVGYDGDKPIMGSADNSKVDKDFVKKYGKTTVFAYGNNVGEFSTHVYRITQTNEDGIAVDLSWEALKERCSELGVKHVPELKVSTISGLIEDYCKFNSIEVAYTPEMLTKAVEYFVDITSTLDPLHVSEGVCVLIGNARTSRIFKHKGFYFKVLEGIIKPSASSDQEVLEES